MLLSEGTDTPTQTHACKQTHTESPNAFRCIQNVLYGSTIYSFKDPDTHKNTHVLSAVLPYHANTLAESGIVSAIVKQNSLTLSLYPLSLSPSLAHRHTLTHR